MAPALTVPTGYALSSVGGQAQYNGAGRMLTQILPYADPSSYSRPGAYAVSKDHQYADSGYTTVFVIAVARQ